MFVFYSFISPSYQCRAIIRWQRGDQLLVPLRLWISHRPIQVGTREPLKLRGSLKSLKWSFPNQKSCRSGSAMSCRGWPPSSPSHNFQYSGSVRCLFTLFQNQRYFQVSFPGLVACVWLTYFLSLVHYSTIPTQVDYDFERKSKSLFSAFLDKTHALFS